MTFSTGTLIEIYRMRAAESWTVFCLDDGNAQTEAIKARKNANSNALRIVAPEMIRWLVLGYHYYPR